MCGGSLPVSSACDICLRGTLRDRRHRDALFEDRFRFQFHPRWYVLPTCLTRRHDKKGLQVAILDGNRRRKTPIANAVPFMAQITAERLVEQRLFQIVQCGEFAIEDGGDVR